MAAQLWIDRTKEFRTPIVADGWSCQTWEVCCCRENGWTKKATIKISRRLLFIPIFYEWYKKIPYSLSIRLYFDQLINLKSIRKADKSKLSCAILIKIYREVTGYQIKIYSSKKKAKKNKGAIWTKVVQTNSKKIVIKNKKLKNKKTLYIRIRAYKRINRKNKYSTWSEIKKVIVN